MLKIVLTRLLLLPVMPLCLAVDNVLPTANGIEIPQNYKNWKLIGVSHRLDKGSLRSILGNATAIKAARSAKTAVWPDGAVLAKLVWKDRRHPDWDKAVVPGELQHVEFMIKDAKKYKKTGGWGYARWVGQALKPYGANADGAEQECFVCHTAVKANDYVFTYPATLP